MDYTLEQLQFIYANLMGLHVNANQPDRVKVMVLLDGAITTTEAKIAEMQKPKLASAAKEKPA